MSSVDLPVLYAAWVPLVSSPIYGVILFGMMISHTLYTILMRVMRRKLLIFRDPYVDSVEMSLPLLAIVEAFGNFAESYVELFYDLV